MQRFIVQHIPSGLYFKTTGTTDKIEKAKTFSTKAIASGSINNQVRYNYTRNFGTNKCKRSDFLIIEMALTIYKIYQLDEEKTYSSRYEKDFLEDVKDKVFWINYKKKDGEIVIRKGTLNLNLIPHEKHPILNKPFMKDKNRERISYFDFIKNDWRSFLKKDLLYYYPIEY